MVILLGAVSTPIMSRAAWLIGMVGLGWSCSAGSGAPAARGEPAVGSGRGSSVGFAVRPGDIAIRDVSVVAMTGDGVLAHQTVVIRGDRIAVVAPSAAVALPDGVTVIEGAGRWLMPGLADMHVHTWRDDDL